jgi:hypothetical protein
MFKARALALYLPQFHPIPENDAWWGKGFTEWTNTAKAKPLFRGHYQPHIPADLGFYDLRVPETRALQAKMAAEYGIEGFCYYHYWFAGKQLLNRPFDEVLASGSPDFPFCLYWANQTWSGVWHGMADLTLIEQTYPGKEDHRAHFEYLLPAFRDPRHIKVDGKPLFLVFMPHSIPDVQAALSQWREMAVAAGLGGLYLIANSTTSVPEDLRTLGFDATVQGPNIKYRAWVKTWRKPFARIKQSLEHRRGIPHRYDMAEFAKKHEPRRLDWPSYPCLIHAWDNTPRSGRRGIVYENSSTEIFRKMLQAAVSSVSHEPQDKRLVFLKSWNEWAEGNHLEPDLRDGMAYLNVVRDVIQC